MAFSCINCICIRGSRFALHYRFFLPLPFVLFSTSDLYAKEWCSHQFVWIWDGWIPRLGHGALTGQKGMSGFGTQGLQRGWNNAGIDRPAQALVSLRILRL